MEATRARPTHHTCDLFDGPYADYQTRAAIEISTATGRVAGRYVWIIPTCGIDLCIKPAHLQVNTPLTIAYPHRVCVYCGVSAATRDHLLPRTWTGDAIRKHTLVVPACGFCNSVINDRFAPCINDRRALAHDGIRRKYVAALRTLDRTPTQLREYGPHLRPTIEAGMARKADTLRRLAWPEDPFYDLRAFQKSGIVNPYELGLLRFSPSPALEGSPR